MLSIEEFVIDPEIVILYSAGIFTGARNSHTLFILDCVTFVEL